MSNWFFYDTLDYEPDSVMDIRLILIILYPSSSSLLYKCVSQGTASLHLRNFQINPKNLLLKG